MTQYTNLKEQIRQLNSELEALAIENKVDLNKERRLAALQVDLGSAKSEHAEEMKQALRGEYGEHHRLVELYLQEGEWDYGGEDYWAEFTCPKDVCSDFETFLDTLDVEV